MSKLYATKIYVVRSIAYSESSAFKLRAVIREYGVAREALVLTTLQLYALLRTKHVLIALLYRQQKTHGG